MITIFSLLSPHLLLDFGNFFIQNPFIVEREQLRRSFLVGQSHFVTEGFRNNYSARQQFYVFMQDFSFQNISFLEVNLMQLFLLIGPNFKLKLY